MSGTASGPMTWADVAALARLTLSDPQAGARAVMALDVPREHNFTLFLLAITSSGAMAQLDLLISRPDQPEGAIALSGFTIAVGVGATLLLLAGLIQWLGRLAGGTGQLTDVLRLMIWLQLLLVALQVVQTLLMLIAPVLASVVAIAGLALSLWLLTHFIAAAHGFSSPWKVFGAMVAVGFGLSLLLSILLTALIGAGAPGGA